MCVSIYLYLHKQMFSLFWQLSSTEAQTKQVTQNTPSPILSYLFIILSQCWYEKTYLEEHLSSELKKEKNKTEMDWTSVPKWKYRHHLLMACHLLVRYKISPSYCSQIYSCYCDQNTLRLWLFSIWWQACRGQLGSYLAVPTMGWAAQFILLIILVLFWICSTQPLAN